MTTQDKQGLSENEREIVKMLAEPPVSQHELFALCLAAKKIIDRISSTGGGGLIDPKEIADEIMDTLIDERNLTANEERSLSPSPATTGLNDFKHPLSALFYKLRNGVQRKYFDDGSRQAPDIIGANALMTEAAIALAAIFDPENQPSQFGTTLSPSPATAEGDCKPQNLANGQPRATSELSAKLKELSEKATEGPWHFNPPKPPREVRLKRPHWEIGQPLGKGCGIIFGDDQSTAAFIVALVNAYRAGDLVAHGNHAEQVAEPKPTTPATDGTG